MTKGLPISHDRAAPLQAAIQKTTIPIQAVSITVDGASGVGVGTTVLRGIPEGNFMILGAVANISFAGAVTGDLVDTWEGDYGIGTTPSSDATISGSDGDIVPSTELAAATAEVSPITRAVQANGAFCGVVHNNTASTLEFNLNLLIDDADISADDVAITAEGVLIVSFVMLGDD